ncbi:histone H1-like [Synchiropus picturatus]
MWRPINFRGGVFRSKVRICSPEWDRCSSVRTSSGPLAAAPAKAAKKKKSTKPAKSGPSVGELIVKAVSASKERSVVSLATIKKALSAGGYDVEKNNARVKTAVKKLVTAGTLVQTKGTRASGSFKMSKKEAPKAMKAARDPTLPEVHRAADPNEQTVHVTRVNIDTQTQ